MQFQIIITGKCNFACTYCMQKYKKNISISDERIEEICNFVIEFFLQKNSDERLGISIIGGEPLCCMDKIILLVNTIKKLCVEKSILKEVDYEISTNASLITKEIVDFFYENRIQPYIGFDGIRKAQNLNRKVKTKQSSFDISYHGIKLVYKNAFLRKSMVINSVITANNVFYLSKNFEFLLKHFKNSSLSLNFAYNTNWTYQSLKELENQLQIIANKYLKTIVKKQNFSLKLIDEQIYTSLESNISYKSSCGGGKEAFSITIDGNILPCGNFTSIGIDENKISIGDIFTGISEEKVNHFQNSIVPIENENCSKCEFSNRCRRFCPFVRYMSSGNDTIINETFCEISKRLIRVTDKFIDKFYKKDKLLFTKKYLNTEKSK